MSRGKNFLSCSNSKLLRSVTSQILIAAWITAIITPQSIRRVAIKGETSIWSLLKKKGSNRRLIWKFFESILIKFELSAQKSKYCSRIKIFIALISSYLRNSDFKCWKICFSVDEIHLKSPLQVENLSDSEREAKFICFN